MPGSRHSRYLELLILSASAGVFSGTSLSGLIFFLNPKIPFTPVYILSAISWHSLLFSSCIFIAYLLIFPTREITLSKDLIHIISVILITQAFACWLHAYHYSFLLPPGINQRLLKAAISSSLASLIAFYTLLVYKFRNLQLDIKSIYLFVVLALASVYILMERRAAYKPELGPRLESTFFQAEQRLQIYVVGTETATLDAILPLEEQGHLPFFSKILSDGSHARLKTLHPAPSLSLWTSLSTGKYPYKHGIFEKYQYGTSFFPENVHIKLLPVGLGFKFWGTKTRTEIDISKSSASPIWELLANQKISSAVVGWPLTRTIETNQKIILSENFFNNNEERNPLLSSDLIERAQFFRTGANEIDPIFTSRFGLKPPRLMLSSLINDLWRKDLFLYLINNKPKMQALFLVLPGLREISESYFGGYSAVQFEGTQDRSSENAAKLLRAYYAQLDEILAQIWGSCREPCVLVFTSPQGVAGPEGWRKLASQISRQPLTKGYTNQGSDGLIMFLGKGMSKNASLKPAEIFDLVPTLLYRLGLPLARDFDGSVLTESFDITFLAQQNLSFIPSYENSNDKPNL